MPLNVNYKPNYSVISLFPNALAWKNNDLR